MNAVNGTTFSATFPIFEGNFRGSSKCVGEAHIKGIVTRDSCYTTDNKHRVWFNILESDSDLYPIGRETWKQGKNFYSYVTDFEYAADYEVQAAGKNQEKDRLGIAHR